MTYSVLFESKALKKLYSFETEFLKRIRRKTDELARNPRPSGVKKLVGENQSGYRIRVGDVRQNSGIELRALSIKGIK